MLKGKIYKKIIFIRKYSSVISAFFDHYLALIKKNLLFAWAFIIDNSTAFI